MQRKMDWVFPLPKKRGLCLISSSEGSTPSRDFYFYILELKNIMKIEENGTKGLTIQFCIEKGNTISTFYGLKGPTAWLALNKNQKIELKTKLDRIMKRITKEANE